MGNLKVGLRLTLGFGFVLILMLLMSGIGVWQMVQAQKSNDFLQTRQEINFLIADWARQVEVNVNQAQGLIYANDPEAIASFKKGMEASSARVNELQPRLEGLLFLGEGKALFEDIVQARQTYLQGRSTAMEALAKGDHLQAQTLFKTDMPQLTANYQAQIKRLSDFQSRYVSEVFADSQQSIQTGLTGLAIATLLALIAGPLLALFISRSLLVQLGGEPIYAAGIAHQIASGDLTALVQTKTSDNNSLLFAMKSMRDSLAALVGRVQTGANSIATASSQITSGNLDLASRTEQQASSLAQTAATMEEITATVRQNTDNARQANVLAEAAAKTADQAGGMVAELVGTMSNINTRSQQVVDIIGVMDSIAFQTNILALNAAVEAARAGEQGRGFAVVASEVRTLAQRSAASAREIKTLIEASVQAAAKGNEEAARTGATMQELVASIGRVTDIMNEITAASQEQTTGIEQINMAVTEMDDVTRQNASLVDESAAAASSLQEQADALGKLIATFRLRDSDSRQEEAQPLYARPALSAPTY